MIVSPEQLFSFAWGLADDSAIHWHIDGERGATHDWCEFEYADLQWRIDDFGKHAILKVDDVTVHNNFGVVMETFGSNPRWGPDVTETQIMKLRLKL